MIARFLAEHEPFLQLMRRLFNVLTDGDSGVEARVRAAMFSAAIGGVVTHPLVAGSRRRDPPRAILAVSRPLLNLPA